MREVIRPNYFSHQAERFSEKFKKISKKGLTNMFIYSRIHLVAEVNTSEIKTNAIVA